MAKRERKTYSDQQREEILATATRDGLTAEGVQKKFGVKPVTYYSWRKKKGLKGPRGRKPATARVAAASGDLTSQVRAGVQAKVREILPAIVRAEVQSYLDSILGSATRPAKPRRQARKKK